MMATRRGSEQLFDSFWLSFAEITWAFSEEFEPHGQPYLSTLGMMWSTWGASSRFSLLAVSPFRQDNFVRGIRVYRARTA
jgi:hypothetical protein